MNELRRTAYLDALGIDSYVSRKQLPGAALTRRLALAPAAGAVVPVLAGNASGERPESNPVLRARAVITPGTAPLPHSLAVSGAATMRRPAQQCPALWHPGSVWLPWWRATGCGLRNWPNCHLPRSRFVWCKPWRTPCSWVGLAQTGPARPSARRPNPWWRSLIGQFTPTTSWTIARRLREPVSRGLSAAGWTNMAAVGLVLLGHTCTERVARAGIRTFRRCAPLAVRRFWHSLRSSERCGAICCRWSVYRAQPNSLFAVHGRAGPRWS